MIECLENKVIVRLAEPNDLPEIFKLIDEYDGDIKHDKTTAKNNVREILYHKSVLLGEYNGETIGGVAGFAFPSLFSNDLSFCVMFLFVRHKHRRMTKQFMQEIELTLLSTKATRIIYGLPSGDSHIHRFMRICGYQELERHYVKRFTT